MYKNCEGVFKERFMKDVITYPLRLWQCHCFFLHLIHAAATSQQVRIIPKNPYAHPSRHSRENGNPGKSSGLPDLVGQ